MLAAGLWLRGPGESSEWVSKVPLGTLQASFLHAVPLRLGLPKVPFPSLFARRATALGSSGARPGWLRPGCALAALVLPAELWLAFLLGFEAVRCRASLLLPTGISCVFRNSPSPAPAQSPVRLRVRNCDPPKRKRALHNHPAVRADMLVALYHNAVADTNLMAAGAALIYTSALARADHFCLALWATVRVSDARCRSFR